MQDGLDPGWQRAGSFVGTFEGYIVQGFKYESDNGEPGWFTMSWPQRDPVHNFWVTGSEFYRATIYPAGEMSSRQRVELFDLVTDVTPQERKAVLAAIKQWETDQSSLTNER